MKILKSLLLTFLITVFSVGCTSKESLSGDEVVAVVNGNNITVDYYTKNLMIQKQAIESIYGSSDIWKQEIEKGKTFEEQVKEMTLEQIINVELIYNEAKNKNLLPTEEEVNKKVEEVNKAIKEDKEYEKNLKEIGIDESFIKRQEEEKLALDNYQKNFLDNTKITDDKAKEYYEKNKKDFYVDEVEASHILISTTDDNGKELSKKEIEKAKKKAEDILKRINNGEDFAKLAKENSDDPGSASKGGDLGYFGKGEMVPEFEEAAFSLKKDEVSEIVKSEYGYHIIKLTDKNQGQTPFEEVKGDIIQILKEQALTKNIENIISKAKIEKKTDILNKIKL